MPQEEIKSMSTANTVREGGKVRPREDVSVFSTGKGKGGHLGEAGTEHVVHAVLAHKLTANGSATLDAPASAKSKKKGGEE